jgi:hypothetical protein
VTEEGTGGPSVLFWGRQLGDTQVVHGVGSQMPQTSEDPIDIQPVLLRILCHLFVDQIPDRGLPEVCESLRAHREFYLSPVETVERLPEPAIKLKLGPSRIRPEFRLDDEE